MKNFYHIDYNDMVFSWGVAESSIRGTNIVCDSTEEEEEEEAYQNSADAAAGRRRHITETR